MSLANPVALAWGLLLIPVVIFYILKIRLRRVPVKDRNRTADMARGGRAPKRSRPAKATVPALSCGYRAP